MSFDVLRRSTLIVCLVAGALVACAIDPPSAYASTVRYRTDAELIALSERVVHARVLKQRTARPAGSAGAIYTVTTLAVLEDFTGVAGDTVEVWELGGAFNGEYMFVGGAVEYIIGDEMLVCLDRGRFGLRSVAMGFSTFDVQTTVAADGTTDGLLRRHTGDTAVVGTALRARERTLAEFRDLSAQVRGVFPRRNPGAEALLPDPAMPKFTLLPFSNGLGPRWVEADSGTPVKWFKNTSAPPPLTSGDAVSEIETALAAWTTPSTATVVLQYGGTTNQVNAKSPWDGIGNGNGVITFEDPNNELSGTTLAIGGGFASFGNGGIVNGTTFNRYTRGYIIFQNAANLSSTFTSSLGFARVLEHELGHGIGLGHTQQDGSVANPQSNIMYPSCCSSSTPQPPALGADDLAGLNFIYPSGVTCTYLLTPSSSSATAGGGPGSVGVTTGSGCAWAASSNASFAGITSGANGIGTGVVGYTVGSNPNQSQRIATLTIAGKTFTITQAGTLPQGSGVPFGLVDTPADGLTGVTGSLPITGWALDDVEVRQVRILRDPVAGEGTSPIFIGLGSFVEGARPDVAVQYPTVARNTRAGWGYLLLTNFLPNEGNGTFRLLAYADDANGQSTLLGARTIVCTNSSATLPFGAIDTPGQGETITGTSYNNFGWVLSPGTRRADPPGGGTVSVVIDGAFLGTPTGWGNRTDLASLFPLTRYAGTATSLGVYTFDPSRYGPGTHTIAWVVTDNQGGSQGVGSRYFTVASAVSGGDDVPMGQEPLAASPLRDEVNAAPADLSDIYGRRGFDRAAPLRAFSAASGRATVHGEELDRFEMHLASAGRTTGYLRVGADLRALPIGSRLDPATGEFTWQTGVGFVGTYDLVFVRGSNGRPLARQDVRIVVGPKRTGRVGPQVVIDVPGAGADVAQPFVVAGWAIDGDSDIGTGVDTLHVWAYPHATVRQCDGATVRQCDGATVRQCDGATVGQCDGATVRQCDGAAVRQCDGATSIASDPIFLGATAYGGARPDVAALFGDRFLGSGYGITVSSLPPGTYDLAVFAWSTATGGFVPAKTVRVTVR